MTDSDDILYIPLFFAVQTVKRLPPFSPSAPIHPLPKPIDPPDCMVDDAPFALAASPNSIRPSHIDPHYI